MKTDHNIHQWWKFLSNSTDKSLVIKFIAEECQNERHREKLAGKTIFVTTEDYCNEDSSIGMTARQELRSTQEEANTRVFLHGPHAAASGYRAVVITSDDTDVFVLFLTFKGFISCPVFVKHRQQTRAVYMDESRNVRMLDLELCRSLPGLHALTDCDSVSAVSGRKGQGNNFEAWLTTKQVISNPISVKK